MKNLLIIIFLALFLLLVGYIIQRPTASKQKPKQSSLTELDEPENWKPENDDCLHRNRYTLTKRLSMYPFNKAAKVLAVSYYDAWDEETDITYDTPDTATNKAEPENEIVDHGIRIVNGVLDTSHLVEIKKLNPAQIDRLTYLLYNIGYKKEGFNQIEEGMCFRPRNAFIFINQQGKVYDYLQICFECMQYSSPSEMINIGDVCNQKYDLLNNYFISIGIKTGTIAK